MVDGIHATGGKFESKRQIKIQLQISCYIVTVRIVVGFGTVFQPVVTPVSISFCFQLLFQHLRHTPIFIHIIAILIGQMYVWADTGRRVGIHILVGIVSPKSQRELNFPV